MFPQTRSRAWRAAVSMFATFPGVFASQLVAFPFVIVILLVFGVLIAVFHSEWLILPLVFCEVGVFSLASLYGFYLGWSLAWQVTAGTRFSVAIRSHDILWRCISAIIRLFRNTFHGKTPEA
jgi:hypothetical protein